MSTSINRTTTSWNNKMGFDSHKYHVTSKQTTLFSFAFHLDAAVFFWSPISLDHLTVCVRDASSFLILLFILPTNYLFNFILQRRRVMESWFYVHCHIKLCLLELVILCVDRLYFYHLKVQILKIKISIR